jgi:murein DD-endopeptidase MepM/ murein hydrolase activator NlpD
MKTPINGARLSSGFGMRRHPILGYSRLHRGTDFAAPTGTPIMAAGDGVVTRAGPFGSFGNYVRIRHGDGYETAYAHLSRFGRGMRAGTRVRQGQIIGYVGTTGRSTGPHLHYEVLRRGAQVNPMGLRMPTGRNLAGRDRELFEIERLRIDTLRQARAQEARAAGETTTAATAIPAVAPGGAAGAP